MYNKDDCGKLTNKDSNNTRRSKQNTYHVVNKNIAPSKVIDRSRRKRGCLLGHPQALTFWCPYNILGVPWASRSLVSCHSLFHNTLSGKTDPRTPMGPADRAPFGSARGGGRTKSRSRRGTRAVYPASELSREITLLLLLVWLYYLVFLLSSERV